MRKKVYPAEIVEEIQRFLLEYGRPPSSSDLIRLMGSSPATVKRLLDALVGKGAVQRTGRARATRYHVATHGVSTAAPPQSPGTAMRAASAERSPAALALLGKLARPIGVRAPVAYQRTFVDGYVPNRSSLLAPDVARALAAEGRMADRQPAGTYARKVLEQLLIDLSWSSSRLEGNAYSLLDTKALFERGVPTDADGVMLLNHKAAIEFLVDAVPSHGLTRQVITNLHSILLRDLLADVNALGSIRSTVVNITGSTYVPSQVPQLLDEMLDRVIEKARLVNNPVEGAFFLWVNIAYLQPFHDGNKRTSRLAANIPLMLYNSAPLAFLDVDREDYARAMLGVYELLDVALAAELFAWTYRRSIAKYRAVLEATAAPDPFRVRHREALSEALQRVVRDRLTVDTSVEAIGLPADDIEPFLQMLRKELAVLGFHNFARYRLSPREIADWVDRGRPS